MNISKNRSGVSLGELIRVGRVADLTVERHDPGVSSADRDECVAVGLAGRDLVPHRVRRRRGRARVRRGGRRGRSRVGERAANGQVAFAAQFGDGASGHVFRQGLAVPVLLVLDFGEPAALDGPGQDHDGLVAAPVGGGGEGLVDLVEVMTVDLQDPGPERLGAAGVGIEVPLELGGPALAEPVDVDDRDQVGQLVVRRLVQGLPDRALGHLAVPAQHPHPVREPVEVLAGQRDAHPVGQALAERSGGDVHPRQHRGGVAFQAGSEAPVSGHQFLVGDHPDRLVDRIQQRGRVALGEDQVVVAVVARVVPVVAQVAADQHREQVGSRHARGGVTGPRTRAGPDGVHPKLRGEFTRGAEVDSGN